MKNKGHITGLGFMTAWPLVQPSLSVDHTQCGASFVVMVGPQGQSIATSPPPAFMLVRTLGRCVLIEGIRGTDSATDIPQHCHQLLPTRVPQGGWRPVVLQTRMVWRQVPCPGTPPNKAAVSILLTLLFLLTQKILRRSKHILAKSSKHFKKVFFFFPLFQQK